LSAIALPADLVVRFRSVALARLERVEGAWSSFLHAEGETERATEVQQELHTLKGEARMMQFVGVATLCHALEGLVEAASRRASNIPEEVDLVVTMAIRFMVVLLRRKDAEAPATMDVEGFVQQIKEVLKDLEEEEPQRPSMPGPARAMLVDLPDRVSRSTQQRLAALAARVFLEHIAAGRARGRLGDVVRSLAEEVAALSSVTLAPRLVMHAEEARSLASSLGKDVEVVFDLGDTRVRAEVVEAVEVVLLHALRNAADHGIERREGRRAAGKPDVATIRVSARNEGSSLEITVEDDGAGIDFSAVRARIVALGVVSAERAAEASEDELVELCFRPGISTRTVVTDVSGRGIGLDAARSAIQRVGGRIRIVSRPGLGMTLSIRVPQASHVLPVVCFPARGADLVLAVATAPGDTVGLASCGMPALDPVEIFDIAPPGGAESGEGVRIELRRGDARFVVRGGGDPYPALATRLCPTSDDCPAELVSVGGMNVLLVRPELF